MLYNKNNKTQVLQNKNNKFEVSKEYKKEELKKNRFRDLPVVSLFYQHLVYYPTPVNINTFWSFGSLAGLALVIQIITGLWLAMHYIPHVDYAYLSVEKHIMRDVNYGWLFRYTHSNGASMFFIVVYLHILRGFYYKSYTKTYVWISGCIIYLLMMATAFFGYVLPWGQMSFWGATVITNFFTAVPYIGDDIAYLIWGGFSVSNATLLRFFTFHFILPFIIVITVIVHIALLHLAGSTNPLGHDTVATVNFYPYFWLKDFFMFYVFFIVFGYLVFFNPNLLGHPANYVPANPLVTPAHIVPEWYFLIFYAMLRSIPNKLGGLLCMLGAILVLFIIPFLNPGFNLGARVSIFHQVFYWFFIADIILLSWVGGLPVEEPYILLGQVLTAFYFLYCTLLLPILNKIDIYIMFEHKK